MNEYDAKFAREDMPKPTDWITVPTGRGGFKLVNLVTGVTVFSLVHARSMVEEAEVAFLREMDYGMMP